MDIITIIALGDCVGKAGKAALRKAIPILKEKYSSDLTIINGENVSGGVGIDAECYHDIMHYGAQVITLGDHAFQKHHSDLLLENYSSTLIRPANFPPGAPGKGFTIVDLAPALSIAVVNLLGRVFIEKSLDCPFRTLDQLLQNELASVPLILVDFHAEATSEKIGLARFFDGRVSLIWGTHTHVQTNDAQILPKGTGYITDLGMTGPQNSVIGMDVETAIHRLISGLPSQHKVAKGDAVVNGIVARICTKNYTVVSIDTIKETISL
jgi:metallophosphoesterase (TIGR00282 family)